MHPKISPNHASIVGSAISVRVPPDMSLTGFVSYRDLSLEIFLVPDAFLVVHIVPNYLNVRPRSLRLTWQITTPVRAISQAGAGVVIWIVSLSDETTLHVESYEGSDGGEYAPGFILCVVVDELAAPVPLCPFGATGPSVSIVVAAIRADVSSGRTRVTGLPLPKLSFGSRATPVEVPSTPALGSVGTMRFGKYRPSY
jgi:hypothetical protein